MAWSTGKIVTAIVTGVMAVALAIILNYYNVLYGGGSAVGFTITCLTIVVPLLLWITVNITSFKWLLRMLMITIVVIVIYFFILFELMGAGCPQNTSISALFNSLM